MLLRLCAHFHFLFFFFLLLELHRSVFLSLFGVSLTADDGDFHEGENEATALTKRMEVVPGGTGLRGGRGTNGGAMVVNSPPSFPSIDAALFLPHIHIG